jgi:hypothetical protein
MMKPPVRIDAMNGTTFLVVGETVEMVRHDQPICRVPREDLREFIRVTDPGTQDQPKTL